MEIKVHATANGMGNLLLHIYAESEKDWEHLTVDLNHILQERLYKEGYPKEEESRLTDMEPVHYIWKNAVTPTPKEHSE